MTWRRLWCGVFFGWFLTVFLGSSLKGFGLFGVLFGETFLKVSFILFLVCVLLGVLVCLLFCFGVALVPSF